jgi:frataxin
MLSEIRFHTIADATLLHLFDQLEDAFENGDFEELELNNGILTIETTDKKTFIISKHAPSCQLWLASPISGGHHFPFDESHESWMQPDGTYLKNILAAELKSTAGVKVIF